MESIVNKAPQRTSAVNDRNMGLRLRLFGLVQPDSIPIEAELREIVLQRLDGVPKQA